MKEERKKISQLKQDNSDHQQKFLNADQNYVFAHNKRGLIFDHINPQSFVYFIQLWTEVKSYNQ